MIQRLQTIFLLAAALVAGAAFYLLRAVFLALPPVMGETDPVFYQPMGTVPAVWFTVFSALTVLLPLATVFLFRRRRMQMCLCVCAALCAAVLGALVLWAGLPTGIAALECAVVAFSVVAWWYVRRDERLVRSTDRLR